MPKFCLAYVFKLCTPTPLQKCHKVCAFCGLKCQYGNPALHPSFFRKYQNLMCKTIPKIVSNSNWQKPVVQVAKF